MFEKSRAQSYADEFTVVFVKGYISLAVSGQYQKIPGKVLDAFKADAASSAPLAHHDAEQVVWEMLYAHKLNTGQDFPLLPKMGQTSHHIAADSTVDFDLFFKSFAKS